VIIKRVLHNVVQTVQFPPPHPPSPAFHSRPFSSLVRLYVVSEVLAVSLTNPRNLRGEVH
jgi:hypothetical protein